MWIIIVNEISTCFCITLQTYFCNLNLVNQTFARQIKYLLGCLFSNNLLY